MDEDITIFNFDDSDDPEIWKNLGDKNIKNGDFENAIKCYSNAIRLDPEYIAAWNNMGYALSKIGKYDEAKNVNTVLKKLKSRQITSKKEKKHFNFKIVSIIIFVFMIGILTTTFMGILNGEKQIMLNNQSETSQYSLNNADEIKTEIHPTITYSVSRQIPQEAETFIYKQRDTALLTNGNDSILVWMIVSFYTENPSFYLHFSNIGNHGITLSGTKVWIEDYAGFKYDLKNILLWTRDGKLIPKVNFDIQKIYPDSSIEMKIPLNEFNFDISELNTGYFVLEFKGNKDSTVKWQFSKNDKRVYSYEYDDRNDPNYLYKKAVHELPIVNRALSNDPKNANLLFIKGIHLFNIGYFPETVETLNEALSNNPKHIQETWNYLGYSYLALNQYSEAYNAFKNANNLKGEAIALYYLGRSDEASAAINEYMKKEKPTDVETWNLYKEITGKDYVCGDPLRCPQVET